MKEQYTQLYFALFIKSPTPKENRSTAILNQKKVESIPEFKSGLLGQNAIALPLAPPRGLFMPLTRLNV